MQVVEAARNPIIRPMPAFMPEAQKAVDYSFGVLESRTAQTLLSPTAPVRGFNARRSVAVNEQERRMANAAEFLARWKARYIDAEGRILEELDTTIAECVEDANEEGFSREDLDQAAGGDLKAYIREAIAKAQGT
jgi:hypothetical protein